MKYSWIRFFPIIHFLAILQGFYMLLSKFNVANLFLCLFIIYGFPLVLFRIHEQFFPMSVGKIRLNKIKYTPWWGASHLQLVYNACPLFEIFLRLIPGAYSLWLRLWGSKIGKNVYWTPVIEILDRNLMIVGDNVVFGHKCRCITHLVSFKMRRVELYLKPIKIENTALVGAYAILSPGVKIESNVVVKLASFLPMNHVVSKGTTQ